MDIHSPRPPVSDSNGRHHRPRTFKVLAALFAVYGAYCLWFLFHGWYFSGGISATASLVTSMALWRGHRSAPYCVYLFGAMIGIYFIRLIWILFEIGWPYQDKVSSFGAIVPGCLVLMVTIGVVVYVYRANRAQS
jgi:hypothetical protein